MASTLRPPDFMRASCCSAGVTYRTGWRERRRTRIQASYYHQRNAAVTTTSDTSPIAADEPAEAALATEPSQLNPACLPGQEDDTPLSPADLQAYMQQHSIVGAIVPPLNGAPAPPGCIEVKSLLFLVGSHPVVS
jgi:hypothetical protein